GVLPIWADEHQLTKSARKKFQVVERSINLGQPASAAIELKALAIPGSSCAACRPRVPGPVCPAPRLTARCATTRILPSERSAREVQEKLKISWRQTAGLRTSHKSGLQFVTLIRFLHQGAMCMLTGNPGVGITAGENERDPALRQNIRNRIYSFAAKVDVE